MRGDSRVFTVWVMEIRFWRETFYDGWLTNGLRPFSIDRV